MKTGTDVSIPECRTSGYPVVDHGVGPMRPQKLYRLTISNPPAWTECGTRALMAQHRPKDRPKPLGGFPIAIWKVETWISYEDLWKQFEAAGEGIKSYCDFKNYPFPHPQDGRQFPTGGDPEKPQPCYLDFVSLAGVLDGYCGIQ